MDRNSPAENIVSASLQLAAQKENLPQLVEFVENQARACDCPAAALMKLQIAVDDVANNICSYSGSGYLRLVFESWASPRKIRLVFFDGGVPFDPLRKSLPDVTLSAEARPIGGLGVFLVRKLMDAVSYERRGAENVLTLELGF